MLTQLDDPAVVDALTRNCSMCSAKKGEPCVCCVHRGEHALSTCPTATRRIVHHARRQAPPRGGQ